MPVAPAFPWVQGLAPARREVVMNLGSVYALLEDARRPVENGPRGDQQPLVGSDIPRCSAGRGAQVLTLGIVGSIPARGAHS